jgi:hypothetical protein
MRGRTELVGQYQVGLTWTDSNRQAWSMQKLSAKADTALLTTHRRCTFERQSQKTKHNELLSIPLPPAAS